MGCAQFLLSLSMSVALAQDPQGTQPSLGDVARAAREQRRQHNNDGSPHSSRVMELVSDISMNDPEDYRGQMIELLQQQDFNGLERAASRANSSKSRFPGGVWKLYTFYDAVSQPVGGRQASEAGWNAHIALLQKWLSRIPESNAAHIALAQAYLNEGSKARGNGTADTVSEASWQKYDQRAEFARAELLRVTTRDPYWYFGMMVVALDQGWDKAQTKALLEESISFEPGFYHVYRQYGNYLQPKWYGAPGEVEAFANTISQRLGGEDGDFVYFEIASMMYCAPCGNWNNPPDMSWPKIKAGYAALQHLYGTSRLKMNRFALLAAKFGDRSAAKEVFDQIGDHWDPEVWGLRETFDKAKLWAGN